MSHPTRRTVLKGFAAAGTAATAGARTADAATAGPAATVSAAATGPLPGEAGSPPATPLHWLGDGAPTEPVGVTWGVPWPRGLVAPGTEFTLRDGDRRPVAVQSWPLAWWPDGTLKWTAHSATTAHSGLELVPGPAAVPERALTVHGDQGRIVVDTGTVRVVIPGPGQILIDSVERDGVVVATRGELVFLHADRHPEDEEGTSTRRRLTGRVEQVTVEQRGPVRAVVRLEGRHRAADPAAGDDRELLPFTVRLVFHAGAESFRMVHSFTLDVDPERDVLCGLGVRFAVPLRGPAYDRHLRFATADGGLLVEAVQGVTGLRRDPGADVRAAQVEGRRLPPPSQWGPDVAPGLPYVPKWGEYRLSQLCADGFEVHKRTGPGQGWVRAAAGGRAAGFGYLGGPEGGLGFGLRNFWQLHPTGLDVRGADTDLGQVTVWLWSPAGAPMELRPPHDGLGMDTYPTQTAGLNITYEDYEPGFGTPHGVARTSELTFWALAATPSGQRLVALAEMTATPPLLVTTPQRLRAAGVFGDWAPVDRSTPERAAIEDRLDFLFEFHRGQVEQHRWYGFWDYGDVMHSYDPDRKLWRYDVGGYAWDNSELGTELWLWYHFLRTGRAEAFRFAEAMTRHTGEVDVHHVGRFAGLGTRHGIRHWGDSAKQLRISTVANRRFLYYLTADERIGDLMHAQIDGDRTFLTLDPLRKVRTQPYTPDPHALDISFGTDWGALAAAWLTEWERRGDPSAHRRLLATMRTIGAQPNGFVQGSGRYDLTTGEFARDVARVEVSHLSAVFGLVETCSELISLVDVPEFTAAWLQYCRLYNATAAEQTAAVGAPFPKLNLRQAHSRLTAYAAAHSGDAALAARARTELRQGLDGYPESVPWQATAVTGPSAFRTGVEAPWVSTNASAQYGLAAIQVLALVG